MKSFLYYYARSMRLYYCFVTGSATLAGVVSTGVDGSGLINRRTAAVLTIGFLAWGVNQVVSDWCDRREDAVNAPHRPMVTGELKPFPALLLSAFMMVLFAVISYFITPWALLILCSGGVLNILYSVLKKIPVLNTFVYSLAITACTAYGQTGVTGGASCHNELYDMAMKCLLTMPAHLIMCHNSYFKDIPGDMAVGIRTLPGLFPKFSLTLSAVLSVLYGLFLGLVNAYRGHPGTIALLICAGLLIFRNISNLRQKRYHQATCSNCQLCVTYLMMFCIIFSPVWWIAAAVSFLLITLVFRWYDDEKE